MASYGTLQILDELLTADNDNVFTYGEDLLYQHISDILTAHNAMTQDIVSNFVEYTTSQVSRYGTDGTEMEMIDIDEWGTPDVQKVDVAGYEIGWPLRKAGVSIGWTRDYFETHTVADMAKQLVGAQAGDVKKIKKATLDGLFRATNYTSIDRLVDNKSIPVKALQNADGAGIPTDPFGTAFDASTHTHLVGRAGGSLAASDISALVENVTEHGVDGGTVVLYLNQAQLAAVQAFTSNFKELQAPMLDPGPGSTDDVVLGGRKDTPYVIDDRLVGVWDGFVLVYVKPWIPANYIVALLVNGNRLGKVLRYRRRPNSDRANLRLVYDQEQYPLRARGFEREFGVGVWNRLAAAILYTGGTSYVQPVLTL